MNVNDLADLIRDATGCELSVALRLAEAIVAVARNEAVEAINDLVPESTLI